MNCRNNGSERAGDTGVILDALRISSDTVENAVLKRETEAAYDVVKAGGDLSAGFADSRVMPKTVLNMIAVGEESGRLEKTLLKVAEIYDRETDASIKVMISLMEPALILILGLVVGFIVIAMFLPIFEISFSGR